MSEDINRLLSEAYKEYLKYTDDFVFIKDIRGVYICASNAFVHIAGYSEPSQLIGKTDFEIFSDKELAKRYCEDDARLLQSGGKLEKYVEPIISGDGRPRYGLTTKLVLYDDGGKPIGIFGKSRDITVEYEAELAYKYYLKNFFELPNNAIVAALFDVTTWRIIDVRCRNESNRIVSRCSTVGEYLENITDLVAEDEEVKDFFVGLTKDFILNEYNSGRHSLCFEYLCIMPDGNKRWIRNNLHFLVDPVSSKLSMVIMLYDIDSEKKEYSRLQTAALQDTMTGLLNHDATIKEISSFIAENTGTHALFMIDLDNFKQVNDLFGHLYGDSVLAEVASIISGVFRTTDITGRLGGDEFMVLMKDVHSTDAVHLKMRELICALQFSSGSDDKSFDLTASVGACILSSGEIDFNTLYAQADSALYSAKHDGKNRYCIYGEQSNSHEPTVQRGLENISTVHLRTLLDYMDGGVVLAEITDSIRITYASPSLFRSFGEAPDKYREREGELLTYVYYADLPELTSAFLEVAPRGGFIDKCFRVVVHGIIQWRRVKATPLPKASDNVSRYVAVLTDISGEHSANDSLREAEERYRIAVEQTDAMLWEVDIKSRTMKHTSSAWKKHGYNKTLFPNAPESYLELGIIQPGSVSEFRRMFDDIYSGKQSGSYYFKIIHNNEYETWVNDKYTLIYDGEGQPYCALCTTQVVQNINAEMEKFEQEQRLYKAIGKTIIGCLSVNLTKNSFQYSGPADSPIVKYLHATGYDEFLNEIIPEVIVREDLDRLSVCFERRALLERFRNGETWLFSAFRRIAEDDSIIHVSMLVNFIRHPISGDVYAFGYLRDNEAKYRWEQVINIAPQHDSSSLLYPAESMNALSQHIFSSAPGENLAVVSIIELHASGSVQTDNLLATFGRLCWLVIEGDAAIGQLNENRVVITRTNIESRLSQQNRITDTLAHMKSLLFKAFPKSEISFVSGCAFGKASDANYDDLLRKADIACRSASKTVGEGVVYYSESESSADGLEARCNELELRCQQQAAMLRVSENDALTGLLSKQAFFRYANEMLSAQPERKRAIVRYDINRFKVFNDVNGTAAGDKLLRDIAECLMKSPLKNALYARLDSDHFAILMDDKPSDIKKSVSVFSKWLINYSPGFPLSASVGIYRIHNLDVDVSLMCDRALLALRSVKSGFDTRFAYYDSGLRENMLREQRLVSDMDTAIENNDFEIYFQPQIDYESGGIIGAEALVRWNHPTLGMLLPNAFIPLLERNGLISRLDAYVRERCCAYMREWADRYHDSDTSKITISVNISRLDIYDPTLCDSLVRLTEKYGIPPEMLHLEITESAYMENPQQLIETATELQKLGFCIGMDDFGSGYSSLNMLKDVTVNRLKLDMEFIDECADSARGGNILSSIIRMAHWLRLPVIAEGVETKTQAEYLKSIGCIYMQGYYFERPMSAESYETVLSGKALSGADRYRDVSVEGMAAFWDPSEQVALMFNSFVGGAAIAEYRKGFLEILRTNDKYYEMLHTTREKYLEADLNILSRFDEENRSRFICELEKTISTGREFSLELRRLHNPDSPCEWMFCRIRLLAKNDNSAIIYASVEDITERKRLELERDAESSRNRLIMESTGIGMFDYDCASDTLTYEVFISGKGITKTVIPDYYNYLLTSKIVDSKGTDFIRKIIELAKSSLSSGEVEYRANLWRDGMRWCRTRYVGVKNSNGEVFRIVGQIDDISKFKQREQLAAAMSTRLNSAYSLPIFNDVLVDRLLELFYNSSDINMAIDTTLALLGEFYDLSRVYICEDVDDHTANSNTFEWCAPGIEPQKEFLSYIPYETVGGYDLFTSNFDEHGNFYCPDVSVLSSEIRAILEPQGIYAMLQCVIKDNGVFSGFIGFDECRESRSWTDEQVGTLMFASRIVGAFLMKLRQSEPIKTNFADEGDFERLNDVKRELLVERHKLDFISAATGVYIWVYNITDDIIVTETTDTPYFRFGDVIKSSYKEVVRRGYIMAESICEYIRLYEAMRNGEKFADATIHFNPDCFSCEWMHIQFCAIPDTDSGVSLAVAVGQKLNLPSTGKE